MADMQAMLQSSLTAALRLYEERLEEAFPFALRLDVLDSPDFLAYIQPNGNGFDLRISAGVVSTISELWSSGGQAIETCLTWLILHELNHARLGHFLFNGGACLVGPAEMDALGLSSRGKAKPMLTSKLSEYDRVLAPLCLELQADDDSTAMLLGYYHDADWQDLRQKIACIFAVMILIENTEAKLNKPTASHPHATTRILMLFGHLLEMPNIPTLIAEANGEAVEAASESEIDRFTAEVVLPCFADAQTIAYQAQCKPAINDLQDMQAFFGDLNVIRYGDLIKDRLNTQAARQLAELWPINRKILTLLQEQDTEIYMLGSDH